MTKERIKKKVQNTQFLRLTTGQDEEIYRYKPLNSFVEPIRSGVKSLSQAKGFNI